jgi:hypothetical protein
LLVPPFFGRDLGKGFLCFANFASNTTDMAIYTIEINERTAKGKALRAFLECEDVVKIKPLSDRDDVLVKEIARGLLDVKNIREGKAPKRTIAQMINEK